MVFARLFPNRILSLSTCNTPSGAWTQGRMAAALAEGGRSVSETIRAKGLRQWLIETNASRLGALMANERLVKWHLDEQSKTPTDLAVPIEGVVETVDLASAPKGVPVPVLLLVGDRSPNCPVAERAELRQAFPDARLLVLPEVGVGVHLQAAERCASEVLRFIESVDRTA